MTQNASRAKLDTSKCANRRLKRNLNRRKKNIEDDVFYVGTSKQASDFEISSEYILNYVKSTFERGNDIAESLQTLTRIITQAWRPQLESSKEKMQIYEKWKISNLNLNSKRIYKNLSKELQYLKKICIRHMCSFGTNFP